jgi:hypothetical protein
VLLLDVRVESRVAQICLVTELALEVPPIHVVLRSTLAFAILVIPCTIFVIV